MAKGEYAQIIGDQELIREMRALASSNTFGKRIQERMLQGAIGLRDKIRAAAPMGAPHAVSRNAGKGVGPGNNRMVGGGNLRRGIVAKKYRYFTPGNPAVFVAIDFRKAPHAYWVEYGARKRGVVIYPGSFRHHPTGRKALKYMAGLTDSVGRSGGMVGGMVFRSWTITGPMPANPFFMPNVERNRRTLEQYISMCVIEQLKWSTAKFEYLGK